MQSKKDKQATEKAFTIINAYLQQSAKAYKGHEKELLVQQDIGFYKNTPLFRSRLKDFTIPPFGKEINGFKIDNPSLNESPFKLMNLQPNKVQQELLKCNFVKCGSYLYNISCGGGKTLVSIEWIHRLKLKTLIISARSAVNDQWLSTLKRVYPQLNVQTRTDEIKKLMKKSSLTITPDVFIITPQYLSKYVEDYQNPLAQQELKNFKFDMIIYDEIHSLISEKYSQVLILPFILKMLGIIKRIPVLLGLTASLPSPKSKKYQLLQTIFGNPITLSSEITKIPIDYIDFRDTIPESERKFMDCNYLPLDSNQAVKKAVDWMIENNIYPSIDYKLIIMTRHINESVYAVCYAAAHFNLNAVLVRTENENDYFFTPDDLPPEYVEPEELSQEDQTPFTLESALELEFMQECRYSNVLNKVGIIVSTVDRLKEGFNCENICFGICGQFVYSETTRVQILGRIRRSSNNEKLNNHTRLFIVNSGQMPSTRKLPKHLRHGMPVICTYDFNREDELFYNENYNRRDLKTYKYREFRDLNNDRIINDVKIPIDVGKRKINISKLPNQNQLKEHPINQIHPLMIRDIGMSCFGNQNQQPRINQNLNINQNRQQMQINQQPQINQNLNINQNRQQMQINQQPQINQNQNLNQQQSQNRQQIQINQNINKQFQINQNQSISTTYQPQIQPQSFPLRTIDLPN